mmetsp:Transcript_21848/g.36559  ORF Transcript_21848/g.36559 Transcript_21848/m.36559 type:complete len:272 (+) Transcript_21848:100-915(+)
MSAVLTDGQNLMLGTIAAFIEAVILQPTLYWKNARAQQLPFTLNVQKIYRGTGAAILSECQQMGLQFLFTGMSKKYLIRNSTNDQNAKATEFVAAGLGGIMASFLACPTELVMIQQQKFGGSFVSTSATVLNKYGFLHRGMMRGLPAAMGRDAIYVTGMLAVTPVLQTHLERDFGLSPPLAGIYASMIGGIVAAVPSHPFDVVKTCMQGDLAGEQYKSMAHTCRTLWQAGGLRRLFYGCMWRTVNITATVYIANECRYHLSPILERIHVSL